MCVVRSRISGTYSCLFLIKSLRCKTVTGAPWSEAHGLSSHTKRCRARQWPESSVEQERLLEDEGVDLQQEPIVTSPWATSQDGGMVATW